MTKKRAPRIQVTLTDKQKAQLEKLAREQGRSTAQQAAWYVHNGMEKDSAESDKDKA